MYIIRKESAMLKYYVKLFINNFLQAQVQQKTKDIKAKPETPKRTSGRDSKASSRKSDSNASLIIKGSEQ